MRTRQTIAVLLLAALLLVVPVAHALPGVCGCCTTVLQNAANQAPADSCCHAEPNTPAAPSTDQVTGMDTHACTCRIESTPAPMPSRESIVQGPACRSLTVAVIGTIAGTAQAPTCTVSSAHRLPSLAPPRAVYLDTCRFLA